MYDKNPNKETLAEEILCEMLDFIKFKIRNHKLTVADSDAIHRILDGIDITGTADDFAKFYGQHPVTVRSVICRKYIGKPRRVVLYSFNKFRSLIPASWRRCTDDADGHHAAKK